MVLFFKADGFATLIESRSTSILRAPPDFVFLYRLRPDQGIDHWNVAVAVLGQERRNTGEWSPVVRFARCVARDDDKNGSVLEVQLF